MSKSRRWFGCSNMYVLLAQLPSLERLLANAGLKHLNDTRLQSINREKHQNYHGPCKIDLFYRCWHTFTGFSFV